jgi:hypothetical protein
MNLFLGELFSCYSNARFDDTNVFVNFAIQNLFYLYRSISRKNPSVTMTQLRVQAFTFRIFSGPSYRCIHRGFSLPCWDAWLSASDMISSYSLNNDSERRPHLRRRRSRIEWYLPSRLFHFRTEHKSFPLLGSLINQLFS